MAFEMACIVALAAAAPAISPTPVALNWKVSNLLSRKQVSQYPATPDVILKALGKI